MQSLSDKFPEHVLVPDCGSFNLVHRDMFDPDRRPASYVILPYSALDLTSREPIVSPNRIFLNVPIYAWDGPMAHYKDDGSVSYIKREGASRLERIASHAHPSQQIDPKKENAAYWGCLFPIVLPLATVGAFVAYAYLTK